MSNAGEIGLAFMQALWAGDLDACDAMMTRDAQWHFQLGMPQAQSDRGRVWPARDALRSIVTSLFDKFDDGGFSVTPTRTIVQGDAVAIEYEATGRTGKGEVYQNYYVTTLDIADGKIFKISPYNDTMHMLTMLS